MSVSVVLKNVCETTGEGPHWDERTNDLLFVDAIANTANRWNAVTGELHKKQYDSIVTLIVPAQSGGYVISVGQSLCQVDQKTGDITKTLCEVDKGTKNRFNDGKCDITGRLWAGTMGHEPVPTQVERHMGSLYTLDSDGTVRSHVSKIDISNGMAWTADGKTMFYVDSLPRKVYAFDCDLASGNICNQRVAVDFAARPVEDVGFPDGMCIDTDDKIWVACYDAGKVIRFDPQTGEELQTVNFPVKLTTSCCWGGPNLDEMYVTSGKLGLTDEEFKDNQPLAGSVFKVTGLGVKGLPAPIFKG